MARRTTVVRNGMEWTLPARPSRDRAELALMSEHLLYEIEAVPGLLRALFFDGRSEERDVQRGTIAFARGNAEIEALLLHVRTLEEFFYKDQLVRLPTARAAGCATPLVIRADTVMGTDFVRDAQAWLDERPHRSDAVKRARARINATLAHLSWDRVTPLRIPNVDYQRKTQTWAHYDLFDALSPVVQVFLKHVDVAIVCEDFLPRARAALRNTGPSDADLRELGLLDT
jgi:hypothetical protein